MNRQFTPKSRAAWRAWLTKHHQSATEVWLVFYKRHTRKPTLSYNDAVEEAVCFGWIDGVKRRLDDERYTHRFSPRIRNSKWSQTNRQRAARMRRAGLMTPAGNQSIAQAKRLGTWQTATDEIDVSMPALLRLQLRKNKKAAAFFDSLSPANQQQFTGWINNAKREATRQRRVDESIRLLAAGERLGMR